MREYSPENEAIRVLLTYPSMDLTESTVTMTASADATIGKVKAVVAGLWRD